MRDVEGYTSLLEHFARYFDAVDSYDLDAIMQLLDGAAVISGGVTTTDPTALRGFYATRQPQPLPDGRRLTKHHATNLIVEGPDDDGVVLARVYYLRLQPTDDGPVVAVSGRLEQRLVRSRSRWRVLQHSIISDF